MTFVERFAPWSDEQKEAAARALSRWCEEQRLEVVRISFPDQHGLLRGKTLVAGETANALHNGCTHHQLAVRQGHLQPDRVSGVDAPAAASASRRSRAPATC